ncbi:MAG: T9SS type A sorting domain-containing protein [candidate division Zixibacteria bacterium]|nr:T9SS type A sorting domain-containing protein [candidate division Zixibacteria bacterium]
MSNHKRKNQNLIGSAIMFLLIVGTGCFSSAQVVDLGSGLVGGGGAVRTGKYVLTGAIPLCGAYYDEQDNYQLYLGAPAVFNSTFNVSFKGLSLMTVSKADTTLRINFGGLVGNITGTLHYRYGGASSFVSSDTVSGTVGDDRLDFLIDDSLLTTRGLEYFVVIRSSVSPPFFIGGMSQPFTLLTRFTNAQGQCPFVLPDSRYMIIGIPFSITGDNSVTEVFGDDLTGDYKYYWRLGRYEIDSAYEYPFLPNVVPGQGYWVFARGSQHFGSAGVTVYPNTTVEDLQYYSIPLDSGWNQLANPFAFPVDWTAVIFDDNGTITVEHDTAILEDTVYWYDGTQYESILEIPAWNGFFVKIKKGGVTALFPYRESQLTQSLDKKVVPDYFDISNWQIELVLESDGLCDAGNFAGVRPDAREGADRYDFSEPPPPPGGPSLAFQLPGGDTHLRRCDYRPPFENGEIWQVSLTGSPSRIVRLKDPDKIPDHLRVWFVPDNLEKYDLREVSEVHLPDAVTKAQLVIGTDNYVRQYADGLLPEDYTLYQNYPNPFNGATQIRFALPEAQKVTMSVFNILGQRVAVLIDGEMTAGYHTVTWPGADDYGKPVASGVYFYRLETGNYVDSRKMTLLK